MIATALRLKVVWFDNGKRNEALCSSWTDVGLFSGKFEVWSFRTPIDGISPKRWERVK